MIKKIKTVRELQVDPAETVRELREHAQSIVDHEALSNEFTYHAPNEDQARRYKEINDTALMLGQTILACTPRSTERTSALRKLQEARMWANASIAINERNER